MEAEIAETFNSIVIHTHKSLKSNIKNYLKICIGLVRVDRKCLPQAINLYHHDLEDVFSAEASVFVIGLFIFLSVRPNILCFLITKAKLNLSLLPCHRGEELGVKLHDGHFFSAEKGLPHSRTFADHLN